MEVDFWGVKISGCENSHATEVKCSNIPQIFHTEKEAKWTSKPQKIQNFLASIPHFPAETTFWSKFFYNTDVVRGFSEQNFPWKWKPQNLILGISIQLLCKKCTKTIFSNRFLIQAIFTVNGNAEQLTSKSKFQYPIKKLMDFNANAST
jgi:hypothetical protein